MCWVTGISERASQPSLPNRCILSGKIISWTATILILTVCIYVDRLSNDRFTAYICELRHCPRNCDIGSKCCYIVWFVLIAPFHGKRYDFINKQCFKYLQDISYHVRVHRYRWRYRFLRHSSFHFYYLEDSFWTAAPFQLTSNG